MLRSRIGWSSAALVALIGVACGESKGDDTHDVPNVGKGGATAGHPSAGKGGDEPPAGRAGTDAKGGSSGSGGSGGNVSAGKGGSAGSTAGGGTGGSSSGKGGGAGQGGSAGQSGGRGGTSGMTGDAGASEGGGDSGALEDLHDVVATACSAAATCCMTMGIPSMLDDCETMYDASQDGVYGIMSGHVTIDSAALARCKAAYSSSTDQCNLNAIVAACTGVFIGHQKAGDPCSGGYDCDRSTDAMSCLITDTSGAHPVGTCAKIPHAKLNEPCYGTCRAGENCSNSAQGIATPEDLALCFEDEGFFCDSNETTPVCKALLALGAQCDTASWDACGSHAECNTTCEKVGELGDPCGSCFHAFQCIEGKCADPAWANESTCMGLPPGP
ncbi:MAG TPA: hypothetical protein VNN72_22885 [Polyangiaceae bacterium]|nr:hypothetical protein [Polyangiaceae bacterium]